MDASEGSARSSVDPDTQYVNKFADYNRSQADKKTQRKGKEEKGLTE